MKQAFMYIYYALSDLYFVVLRVSSGIKQWPHRWHNTPIQRVYLEGLYIFGISIAQKPSGTKNTQRPCLVILFLFTQEGQSSS